MKIHAYRHSQLMEESELRVEMTTHSFSPADMTASRVLERRDIYRRWEAEHDRLLRPVSSQRQFDDQVVALRGTAFGLVHRCALFQYLRDRHPARAKRRKLFGIFYGCRDFANAVLAEHGNFVRGTSSYLATQHLAEHLMHDHACSEPLQMYEQWYTEYFQAYCDIELADSEEEKEHVAALEALRPLLKLRLAEARQAILAMPHTKDQDWRELKIRKPNGDTQRLKTIFGHG
ncbi:MAG: hypothetical protein JOZ67_08180 [Gammaproteobacteria bacterium]|nr:hypothetical protein [Gammaproteobacteria bacterium]MBV9696629.1 hypothetical protein [Gammaproteobacteria bacterium]